MLALKPWSVLLGFILGWITTIIMMLARRFMTAKNNSLDDRIVQRIVFTQHSNAEEFIQYIVWILSQWSRLSIDREFLLKAVTFLENGNDGPLKEAWTTFLGQLQERGVPTNELRFATYFEDQRVRQRSSVGSVVLLGWKGQLEEVSIQYAGRGIGLVTVDLHFFDGRKFNKSGKAVLANLREYCCLRGFQPAPIQVYSISQNTTKWEDIRLNVTTI